MKAESDLEPELVVDAGVVREDGDDFESGMAFDV